MHTALARKPANSSQPSTKITPHIEIETRYFVPTAVADHLAQGAPSATIEQHYFRRSTLQHIIEELKLSETVASIEELTSGRVRKTQRLAQASGYLQPALYQLELKGRKQPLAGASKRPEVSLTIYAERFRELKAAADGGTVCKQRYEIPGRIFRPGSVTKVVAQLDRYIAAGAPPEPPPLHLNTVEIEVPDKRLINALKKGHHEFNFLDHCIDVATLADSLQDLFRNRSIARTGFTVEFCEAIRKLERASEKKALANADSYVTREGREAAQRDPHPIDGKVKGRYSLFKW